MNVLVLYNRVWHYRVPIFNLLNERVNLDVAFTDGEPSQFGKFKQRKLKKLQVGKFVFIKDNLTKLCSNYDAVVIIGQIAWLNYSLLPFSKNRSFKVIIWSIGVSASYTKRFDQIKRYDWLRNFFYRRADALIFYSDYPIKKYLNKGFKRDKLFVANNTVAVTKHILNQNKQSKKSILFIGTLYKAKGIRELIKAFHNALKTIKTERILEIIGDGPDFDYIKKYVDDNHLSGRIILHGAIFEESIKKEIFQRSIAVISPYQAGLGVLESFAYGVPFVTYNNSFTGGERFNIIDHYNGLLYDPSKMGLLQVFIEILSDKFDFTTMGNNAYKYYWENRTPEQMANILYKAIESTLE